MTHDAPIVYVHTGIWPSPSPSTVFVTGTAWGLAHHSPTVFIVRNGSTASNQDVFSNITDLDIPDSLTFHRIGFGGKTPEHTRFFIDAVKTIGRLVKTRGVKAVITRNIGFLPYLTFIRKRYSVPCLFETHDFYGDTTFRTDIKRTIHTYKRHKLERHLLPRLDGVICLTIPQQKIIQSCYPAVNSIVAPTGLLSISHTPPPDERMLCYTGSLDPHKGLGTALAALGKCTSTDIKLHIIGGKTEQEKQSFLSFAHLMGVSDRVRLTTWVHHSDIGHLIDQSHGGLVPLRDTPFNRHLTSPLKILDYFARCRPVIASDLPSTRFYIKPERNGLLFEPDNPDHLAETIDRFFAGTYTEKCVAMIKDDAESLRWTERGNTLVQFIQTL